MVLLDQAGSGVLKIVTEAESRQRNEDLVGAVCVVSQDLGMTSSVRWRKARREDS